MKLMSLFDGSGGFGLAGAMCGITPTYASEIEPYPIAVTTSRFPNMKHLGSVTDIKGNEIEPVDVITFGSPCFPAGTLVFTEAGYKNIEGLKVGDKVFTHKGNWKAIVDIGYKFSPTVEVKGNHYGLVTTPNHPFYSGFEEWTPAAQMAGRKCASPSVITTDEQMQISVDEAYQCAMTARIMSSHNFFIPADGYSADVEVRKAMLKGLLFKRPDEELADENAYFSKNKAVSFGVGLLAQTLGYSVRYERREGGVAVYLNKTNPNGDIHYWYDVEAVTPYKSEEKVYNITVEDDHSYIVEGYVVHNCQDLSVAGKRAGLKREDNGDDETTRSGLFMEAIRIIKEMREATNGAHPRFAVWENVCFAADTLVTTSNGLKQIQNIEIGELVKTKSGEYHRVVDKVITPSKETIKLSVCGSLPLHVTPNHPFWVRHNLHTSPRSYSAPDWKAAGELTVDDWVGYRVDGEGSRSIGMAFAYAVGRWLADGSVVERGASHNGKRGGQRHRIFISTGYSKYEDLKQELNKLPYPVRENKMKHAVNFTFTSDEFAELIKECGKGALNKKMPVWIFSLIAEEQAEVLRGYLAGDGHIRRENQVNFGTSSKELAYGIARLVRNVYHVGCSISTRKLREDMTIEGRKVNAHVAYVGDFCISCGKKISNGSFYENGFVWCKVKSIEQGEVTDVYNLSVEDDNTYEANGIAVHNCGAYSSNKGEDFRTVLEEFIKINEPSAVMPPVPQKGWSYYDCFVGDGWSVAYRTMDAQFWGVPQRRRRIYLVADFTGGCAGEILFKREGLRGYFEKGRTPWQGITAYAQGSTRADDREGAGQVVAFAQNQRDEVRDLEGKASALQAEPGMKQQTFIAERLEAIGCDQYNGDLCGEKASTLGVNCDQSTGRNGILVPVTFEPGILKREGGHIYEGVSGTLRAECHGNVPCVLAKAWNEKENNNCVYAVENHPADSRVNLDESGTVQCLTGRMGTGGGNVPMVMEKVVQLASGKDVAGCLMASGYEKLGAQERFSGDYTVIEEQPVYCLQGNGIDRADTAGCNGKGWKEDASYTLNTIDRPAVVYALDRASFNQGENAKYDFEISDKGIASPLVARGPSVVHKNLSPTLTCTHYGEPAIALKGSDNECVAKDKRMVEPEALYGDGSQICGTLTKNNAGGNQRMPDKENFNCIIEGKPRYIVRRLTPTECARLQGFPDEWMYPDHKEDFTDEEYKFWLDVRNTHAQINGKQVKEYTKPQMLTWYNKLHTDSSAYKMWGNGIALPNALYVMQGIADVFNQDN